MDKVTEWTWIQRRCERLIEHIEIKQTQAQSCYELLHHWYLDHKPDIDILDFSWQTEEQAERCVNFMEALEKRRKETLEKIELVIKKAKKKSENKVATRTLDDDPEWKKYLAEQEENFVGIGLNEDFEKIREIDIKNYNSIGRICGFYIKLHNYIVMLAVDADYKGRLDLTSLASKSNIWKWREEALLEARKIKLEGLEDYERVLNEKLMLMIGYWSAKDFEHRQYHSQRTARAKKAKDDKRQAAKREAVRLYINLLKEIGDGALLLNKISETKMLNMIKERLDPYLKGKGLYDAQKGISVRTLQRMIREAYEEGKINSYPWLDSTLS